MIRHLGRQGGGLRLRLQPALRAAPRQSGPSHYLVELKLRCTDLDRRASVLESTISFAVPVCTEHLMSSRIVVGVALALASLFQANVGWAEDAPTLHKGPWPIHNGRNYQPTEHGLRALHLED